ncbi:MAG: tetratricopeptide repeat protein [Longimicrobiales bacterium]
MTRGFGWHGCAAIVLTLMCSAVTRAAAQEPTQIAAARRMRDAGQYASAIRQLDEYLTQHPSDAGVHWLRAQILYQLGDYARARSAYARALEITPNDAILRADIVRFNADVAHATSPWVRALAGATGDDQPIRTGSLDVEAGFFAAPSAVVKLTGRLDRYASDSTATAPTVVAGGAGVSWSPAGTPITLSGGAAVEGGNAGGATLTGHAIAAFRVASQTAVRASVERSTYHGTLASLDTAIAVRGIELALDRSGASGFGGLVAVRSDRYPDGTEIRSAYVWVLAPVTAGVRLGLASAHQDANDSRWNGKRFDPYYTPENVTSHSALGELRFGRVTALQINGSYGFSAHEDAPVQGRGQSQQFVTRSFKPWTAAASASIPRGTRMTLYLRAAHERTSFYDVSRASVAVMWLAR